jgi:hypothetical protein
MAYHMDYEEPIEETPGPDRENTITSATQADASAMTGNMYINQGCCWRNILRHQPDFLAERPKIVKILEGAGHEVMFLPKFHCELNPIELVWSMIKTQFRKGGGRSSIAGAREALARAMDKPTFEQIRACFGHCWKYHDAYEVGIDPTQAANAIRVAKTHTRIPDSWAASIAAHVNGQEGSTPEDIDPALVWTRESVEFRCLYHLRDCDICACHPSSTPSRNSSAANSCLVPWRVQSAEHHRE